MPCDKSERILTTRRKAKQQLCQDPAVKHRRAIFVSFCERNGPSRTLLSSVLDQKVSGFYTSR